MNIFALRDDEIQIFYVNVNEKLVKATQSKIDKWNGKGEIKEFQGVVLMGHTDLDKKIEIVSSEYVSQGDVFYSGLYARELHGADFQYTTKQKKEVKRKILSQLPTSDLIMKVSK